jgi:acyl-CoA synthetase (AMP-forming)/AMP-acid ligase II
MPAPRRSPSSRLVGTGRGRHRALTAPGDRVAILAENRAEYVECYYAVPQAGRLLVPLNQRLHPAEWTGTLRRSGARVLIVERDLLARLDTDAAHAAGVETIIELDGDAELAGTSSEPAAGARDDEVAWLIGTSGTTGTPKLAMLTKAIAAKYTKIRRETDEEAGRCPMFRWFVFAYRPPQSFLPVPAGNRRMREWRLRG